MPSRREFIAICGTVPFAGIPGLQLPSSVAADYAQQIRARRGKVKTLRVVLASEVLESQNDDDALWTNGEGELLWSEAGQRLTVKLEHGAYREFADANRRQRLMARAFAPTSFRLLTDQPVTPRHGADRYLDLLLPVPRAVRYEVGLGDDGRIAMRYRGTEFELERALEGGGQPVVRRVRLRYGQTGRLRQENQLDGYVWRGGVLMPSSILVTCFDRYERPAVRHQTTIRLAAVNQPLPAGYMSEGRSI